MYKVKSWAAPTSEDQAYFDTLTDEEYEAVLYEELARRARDYDPSKATVIHSREELTAFFDQLDREVEEALASETASDLA